MFASDQFALMCPERGAGRHVKSSTAAAAHVNPGRLLLLCVVMSMGTLMSAQAPGRSGERSSDDLLERGRLIASGGGPGGPSAACFACHGINGEGQAVTGVPALAGLSPEYQFKQLNDFASGARPNDIMTPVARALGAQDRKAVSLFYAQESGRASVELPEGSADPLLLQEGAVLYAIGAAGRGVQGCINCHGPGAQGLAPSYPALAGQPASYIADQLRQFRRGARTNDVGGVMRAIADHLTDRDIEALATYLSSLAPASTAEAEWRRAISKQVQDD